jgi:hypothetical protein
VLCDNGSASNAISAQIFKTLAVMLKMKHLITTILICILFSLESCKGQENFEGKITYQLKYYSNDPNIDIKVIEKFYGTTAEFFHKDGNLKWNLDGNYWKNNIYIEKENKAYLETGTDTIFWENANVLSEKVISYNITKNALDINNYKCDLLTLELESVDDRTKRIKKIYFSSKAQIDPSLFTNCNWNNLNFIYSKTKSFPLKIIDAFDGLTMEYEVIKIEQKPIDSSLFVIKSLPLVELK